MRKIFIPLLALLCLILSACGGLEQDHSTVNEKQDDVNIVEDEKENSEQTEEEKNNSDDTPSEKEERNDKIVEGDLRAHYIDVGQGDSTFIEYSYEGTNYHILIDTGNWNSQHVVNYLDTYDITHIDLLVGTHAHADHIGQMDQIIKRYDVDEVWMAGHSTTSSTFERVIDSISMSDAGYYEPRAGEIFDIGSLTVEVVHPSHLSGNLNDDSISMKLTYGTVSFLFTGDTEHTGEQEMLNRGHDLKANILHLGHHGSSTSTTANFLAAVSPNVAIYSAGIDNSYGHPHDEIVDRVLSSGIDLYGTDTHGTVIVTTDGSNYSIQTKHDGTITPSPTGNSNYRKNDSSNVKEKEAEHRNGCVNINEASFDELLTIKHIGPDRAEQIINLRPFHSVNDLIKVKGIGESRLSDIMAENIACVGG